MSFDEDLSSAPRNEPLLLWLSGKWSGKWGGGVMGFGIGVIQTHSSPRDIAVEWESVSFAGFNDGFGGHIGVSTPSPVKVEDLVGWAPLPTLVGWAPLPTDDPEEIVIRAVLDAANDRIAKLEAALNDIRATALTAVTFGDWSSVESSLNTITQDAEKALEITE